MSAIPESFRSDSKLDQSLIPPQSVDAEQAVLGGLMIKPEAWIQIGDWLTEVDFYRRDHKLIFRCIREQAIANKPVDAVTMGEWFEANGLIEQSGGASYLIDLWRNTPSAANIVAYAEIVLEKSKLRQFIAIGTDAVSAGFKPDGRDAGFLISDTQRRLARLNGSSAHIGPQPPKGALHEWFRALSDRYEAGDAITGLLTPWHDVNELTCGWQPGELIIVAARPNIGKSILGFNQLAFSGLRGSRCLGFSLEMSYPQVLQRMVAALGDIPHAWLNSPASDREADHFAKLNYCIRDLSAANFLVDDQPRLTAEMIVARAKREHMRSPLSMVLVDHLHDMRRPGKDLVNEIADDCRVLKALAKELKVVVIVLAQLNRQGTDRPVLKDLRASGGIEEVADLVLLMHREDYQKFDGREHSPVELIVAKGRNVPSGKTIYLKNRYDVQRLDDLCGYAPPIPKATSSRGFGGKGRSE
jgi:replicative DNA helicase